MTPATMFSLLMATAACGMAVAQDACTFQPNCDYGKGSRASSLASTQEQCCSLCADRPGCAAGVWDGTNCWFKTENQVP